MANRGVNLLDANIPREQRDLLRAWGIHCRIIGQDIACSNIGDDNIIVLLHRLKQPTLFTRDADFCKPDLLHAGYGLVWLDAAPEEAAMLVRRFLHHPQFRTKARRMGRVIRLHPDAIHFLERNQGELRHAA